MANITLDIQRVYVCDDLPSDQQLQLWAETALLPYNKNFELTVRIVDNNESQQLNKQYRDIDKPTNILTFPFEVPEGIELDLIGDLVVAANVVTKEAFDQHKQIHAHWAHMIIHGCLHLLGYDHITQDEADEMEAIEIRLMAELSHENPYIAS